jgi:hypothetical protein
MLLLLQLLPLAHLQAGAPVVVQHLFRGGDGLPPTSAGPNATTFEIAGLVSLHGVSLAFAAMSCPGQAKHSSAVCPGRLAGYGSQMIGLRRSTDSFSSDAWRSSLIVINTTVPGGSQLDSTTGPVPVADHETGTLFVTWARKAHRCTAPKAARKGGLGICGVWAANSTDLGMSWGKPVNITPPDLTASHHRPGIGSYGHGVQIQQGRHKGRLLVQFYGSAAGEQAWFYYSDHHGAGPWEASGAL